MAMLVLARKPGESVQIGENVELRVLSISGKRVRIGLVCPRGVRILRSELMEHQFVPADGNAPGAAPTTAASVGALLSAGPSASLREL
jgi:carbon storage regulator